MKATIECDGCGTKATAEPVVQRVEAGICVETGESHFEHEVTAWRVEQPADFRGDWLKPAMSPISGVFCIFCQQELRVLGERLRDVRARGQQRLDGELRDAVDRWKAQQAEVRS